jgi:hypothetical protein
MLGTTSAGILHQLRDTPYAGAVEMLLHINRKFTMGKLKSYPLSKSSKLYMLQYSELPFFECEFRFRHIFIFNCTSSLSNLF